MKKTGLEIVEMRAKGNIPKIIKVIKEDKKYYWDKIQEEYFDGTTINTSLDILAYLNEEFEIIEKPKIWKPDYGEEYWSYTNNGEIGYRYWRDNDFDDFSYKTGNCFKTEKEVQKALEKINIYGELKRYAEEHNTEKIDWNNENRAKYFIKLYHNKLMFDAVYSTRVMNQIYFTSEEIAEQAIKEIGEDNIRKLFEEE